MRPHQGAAGDEGFTVIEVIVAMSLFAVLSAATLGITLRTAEVAAGNHRRVEAANLANRQVEAIRGMRAIDIQDGRVKTYDTIGGTRYTIVQDSAYVADSAHSTICSGTSNQLPDKRVTVTVTWPDMGDVKPVKVDTLRAVGIGTVDPTKGSIAVLVKGATGAAVPDIPVTITPGGATVTTGGDGCAVFANLAQYAPGYTLTANAAGYVGSGNSQTTSTSVGVTPATVTRIELPYDTVRQVTLTPSGPAGTPANAVVPSGVPVMIRSASVGPVNLPPCAGGTTGCLVPAAGALGETRYVYPEVYDVWTGTCADTNPRTSLDLRPPAVNGGSLAVGMGSALVDVQVGGVSTGGRALYIRHASDASCPGGASYPGLVSVAGGMGVLLPYGTWTISLQSTFPVGSKTATVTLDAAGAKNVLLSSAT